MDATFEKALKASFAAFSSKIDFLSKFTREIAAHQNWGKEIRGLGT